MKQKKDIPDPEWAREVERIFSSDISIKNCTYKTFKKYNNNSF
jgi:hypothetical protein